MEQLYNKELEREFIAAYLSGGRDSQYNECRKVLDADDFSVPDYANAWRVFDTLATTAQPINLVSTVLTAKSIGVTIGDNIYDATVNTTVVDLTAIAVELHVLAAKRRLLSVINHVSDNLAEVDYSIDDAASTLLKAIDSESRATAAGTIRWNDIYMDVLQHAETMMNGNETLGCMCGVRGIDNHGGLLPGDLNIIAGRTSSGKTSLSLTIALGAALRGAPVAIYSLEMPVRDLSYRLSSMLSGIPAEDIERTSLSAAEFSRLYTSLTPRLIAEAPIYFDKNRTSDAERIMQSIRRMVAENGVRSVVIDYAQLLSARGNVEQRVLIGRTANALKAMAVELNITIFLLSQLARPVRGGSNVPRLTELKESGELENAADNVYMVYRPELYQESFPSLTQDWSRYETHGNALIIRAKARKGPVGEFMMGFDGRLTKFFDRDDFEIAVSAPSNTEPF